jgi:diguanylate cyclase (GGDEF)-like protein/PAS domain S-box-containing protein
LADLATALLKITLLLTTVLVSGALAFVAWRRRVQPGALPFFALVLSAGMWSLCDLLVTLSPTLTTALFWSRLAYLGISTLPVFWLLFALDYTQRGARLGRVARGLLFIVPGITILLAFTNNLHQLIWRSIQQVPGPLMEIAYTHGAWFWLAAVYFYLLLIIGTLTLLISVMRSAPVYRWQVWIVTIGAAIPWAANLLYLANLFPVAGVDPTPFAFGITCLLYSLGLWRYGIFELAPVARDTLVDSMSDGFLVVDAGLRLVDANQAAQRMLNLQAHLPIGRPVIEVVPRLAMLPSWLQESPGTKHEVEYYQDKLRYLDIHIDRLQATRDSQTGWLILVRDITHLKEVESQLRDSEESYRTLVESSGLPMILTSLKDGTLLYANQKAELFLSYQMERVIGQPSVNFYQDPRERQKLLEHLNQSGEREPFVLALRTEEGHKFWVQISARKVYYQGQQAVLTIFQDITAQQEEIEILEQARSEAEMAREMAEINARQLQQALTTLESLAITDDLTGALNRRRFIELMARELSLVVRYSRPAAVIMFDLDGFKEVNDTFGHQAGDDVLQKLSSMIRANLRTSDDLVRWGGDEFIILAPEINLEQCQLLAEKIRTLISATSFPVVGQMTSSLGVTLLVAGDTPDVVVRRADQALYQAKEGGGNQVVIVLQDSDQ